MPKQWGLTEAFAHFGARGRNPRWSWSARSEDGRTVVLTLWKDEIFYRGKIAFYDTFNRENLSEWGERPGNWERLENLKWARDHCNGRFRVVITIAEDPNASPRKIAECYPQSKLLMCITDLNEETGEFRATSIDE
jgi:hypothetical protein